MFNWFKKDEGEDRGKGLVKSPRDDRDYALSSTIPEVKRIPEEKPLPYDLEIHDQTITPSCVGQACATIKEGMERKERVNKVFDGLWLYNECKKIDGYDGPGTYFRTGLKVLKNTGAKPKDSDEDPSKYQIESYYKVDDLSFEGLKKAIAVYDFVLAGFKGSNEGWKGEVIREPKEGEQEWGHATVLVGYTKDYLIGQNSWGDYFWVHKDSGGYFKVPKDYLPFEAWAITLDKPNEVRTVGEEIKGWVAKQYTSVKDGKRTTDYRLNLREKPGTDQEIVETLDKGAEIKTDGQEVEKNGYVWIPVLT